MICPFHVVDVTSHWMLRVCQSYGIEEGHGLAGLAGLGLEVAHLEASDSTDGRVSQVQGPMVEWHFGRFRLVSSLGVLLTHLSRPFTHPKRFTCFHACGESPACSFQCHFQHMGMHAIAILQYLTAGNPSNL